MTQPAQHRRRVGAVRPSHIMFTAGVGAVIDMPNFAVLVLGLDEWRYEHAYDRLAEPRLLAAVQSILGPTVVELRPPPWLPGTDDDPSGPAGKVGVPVIPFPQWLRCTACDELGPYHPSVWPFVNDQARRPDQAHFSHSRCPTRRRAPLAVPARFVLSCTAGHLDDFPYRNFVHQGSVCPAAENPRLLMRDYGGNVGANVRLECSSCGATRNINQALGEHGRDRLPRCRGRHPHLQLFTEAGCLEQPHMLVLGASNQWFAETLSALAVPKPSAGLLDTEVERHWTTLTTVHDAAVLTTLRTIPAFRSLARWTDEEIWNAIQRRRELTPSPATYIGYPDLRTPEWRILISNEKPTSTPDLTVHRDPAGVPAGLATLFSDVVQVERLREVRALVGFTRLDAPDPDDPDLVRRAPLSRGRPTWVPASEVRGEGIFLRVAETTVAAWEDETRHSDAMYAHQAAYVRFRTNRYSDRRPGTFDPLGGWPGPRYIALHTLSHLLIRAIALECGYNSASLSERIYANAGPDSRAGILIYTAVPDAEGTLGGLVSLAEPETLDTIVRRALSDAQRCSSDPLCAERLPQAPADFLHGAACHVCLFVSETTCERGNRFLDRRFVVPIDDPKLALAGEL